MKFSILSVLFGLFAQSVVSKPAANPQITPAPLVKRDQAFVGFYSETAGATTDWIANNCLAGLILTTSGNYFKCCPPAEPCEFYTGCYGTSILAPDGETADCNGGAVGTAAISYCSSDIQYPSLGATSSLENFWCGTTGQVGTDYYLATTSGSTTPSTSSTPTTSIIPGPTTPAPLTPKKSTSIGAIVGGVIGGLVVIALAAIAIFLLRVRSKRNEAATQPNTFPGANQKTSYLKTESEPMSPQSHASSWGAASPTPLHDSMYKDPNDRMSPPPMSGSPGPTPMYMPQSMQMPIQQMPVQQMPMQQAPMQQVPMQQSMYHQPASGAQELASSG